jgi:hypothetical protein
MGSPCEAKAADVARQEADVVAADPRAVELVKGENLQEHVRSFDVTGELRPKLTERILLQPVLPVELVAFRLYEVGSRARQHERHYMISWRPSAML